MVQRGGMNNRDAENELKVRIDVVGGASYAHGYNLIVNWQT